MLWAWWCVATASMLRITAFPQTRAVATVRAWLSLTESDVGARELRLFLDACAVASDRSRGTVACVDGGEVCALALVEAPPIRLVSLTVLPGNLEAGSVLCRTFQRVDARVVADHQLAARWRIALSYFDEERAL